MGVGDLPAMVSVLGTTRACLWEPAIPDTSHLPACSPGLPGRTCGAQWGRGFSRDSRPGAGLSSSGPHILPQEG